MPEHTRSRDEAHVEAATTDFVSHGPREVRLPDIRWTLDRLTVELTVSTLICPPTNLALAGAGRSADRRSQECATAAPSATNRTRSYLFDIGDIGAAIEPCRREITYNDRNPFAYSFLAWAHLGADNLEGARQALNQTLAIAPRAVIDLYRLGYTLRLQGQYREAIQAFSRVGQVDDGDIDRYYSAGVAASLMHDAAYARSWFERFRRAIEQKIRHDPSDAGNRFDYALVLTRLGEPGRGWSEAQQAFRTPRPARSIFRSPSLNFPQPPHAELSTDGPDAYFDLARILAVRGQRQQAIDALGHAIDRGFRNYIWMKVNDDLHELRGDARFEALIRAHVKLPG
jgi:tetratricopeptide (TPR) repeat protein